MTKQSGFRRNAQYLTFFSKKDHTNQSYSMGQLLGLILGPLLFVLILSFFHPVELPFKGVYVLGITVWIAIWWITEAIPIAATSFLPLILLPLGHVLSPEQVSSEYGNDIIFLFLGGFILAIAMERWNLHTRVALTIIRYIGASTSKILLGFMIATGFLSMFVSNTAAVMIMIPIGLAIIKEANELKDDDVKSDSISKFEKSLVLAIGYSGTIGGLGTLIGTPPLIILKGQFEQHFGQEISFAKWMIVGIPTVIILIALAWAYLRFIAFRHDLKYLPGGQTLIEDKLNRLGKMSYEEKVVQAIFILASLLWITREFILKNFSITSEVADGTIAIFISILLFIMLDGVHPLVIVIVITIFVLFLTEVTSNTATATMILPILAALSVAVGVHPLLLMVPAAMAANCAYMLPVGTPPNAIIFGSGKLSIKEMAKVGVWVNLISAVIIIVVVYFLMPHILGFDISDTLNLK